MILCFASLFSHEITGKVELLISIERGDLGSKVSTYIVLALVSKVGECDTVNKSPSG